MILLSQTRHVIGIEQLEAVNHVMEDKRFQQIVADHFYVPTKAHRE